MVLVLIETAAGYGLFRVDKPSLLEVDPSEIFKEFNDSDNLHKIVSLASFSKFKNTKDALNDIVPLVESKMGKKLKSFLKKNIVKINLNETLAVSDKLLGASIKKSLPIEITFSENTNEIIRGIRSKFNELVTGLLEKDNKIMSLSLSHSLNRFKLKFSSEKIDTMIIQAVALIDDSDKELNNLSMRLKEWYGWHFPELVKIVSDNLLYAKIVQAIGMRKNLTEETILTHIIPDDMVAEIKQASSISMGTDILEEDILNIRELANRVIDLNEHRVALAEYLKYRMNAIAPNLTYMVGEHIGARLISHAGSLMALAKHPASTVQILGAEKAMFTALKTKHETPKYGIIFHAHHVAQSQPKIKGKISRILAAKLALCSRVDALGDQNKPTVAIESKQYIDRRLKELQQEHAHESVKSFKRPSTQKYIPNRVSNQYNVNADFDLPSQTNQTIKKMKL